MTVFYVSQFHSTFMLSPTNLFALGDANGPTLFFFATVKPWLLAFI